MARARALFITGTDTGVGKTRVATTIVRYLRTRGIRAVGFKPILCGEDRSDAEALFDASDNCGLEIDEVNPVWLRSPVAPFAAAGLSFLAAAFAISRVRPRPPERRSEPVTLASMLSGFSFIASRRILLGVLGLDLCAVLIGSVMALLPVFARDILAAGPTGLGLLRAAPAVGALGMSVWLARHPIAGKAGRGMLVAVAVFGAAIIVFGLSRTLWLSLLALAVLGAADVVSVVVRQTLVQLETPDAMRGRVGAVNAVFIGASNQLGEFESGATAALLGPVGSVVLGGIGTMLVALGWRRLFPSLAERDRL